MVDALVSDASGETRGSSSLLGRTKNMNYKYRRHNPKVIALIIEIALLVIASIVTLVLNSCRVSIPVVALVIVFGGIIFSMLLTLSLLRYDAMRDIRADGSFKGTNLPLYTDQTTLLGHDIKEEEKKDRN